MNAASAPPWNQCDLCSCGKKKSLGEILSVNYLFYGSRGNHTRQLVELNRIFHESLSFILGCLSERLCFWRARGNNSGLFKNTGPQKSPKESSCSLISVREQSGSKFKSMVLDPQSEASGLSLELYSINFASKKNLYRKMSFSVPKNPSSLYMFFLFIYKKLYCLKGIISPAEMLEWLGLFYSYFFYCKMTLALFVTSEINQQWWPSWIRLI